MDFSFSEEQLALRDLAAEILEGETSLERLKSVEGEGRGVDAALWQRLAEANLLGLAVPESCGGMGMGLVELCLLLEQVGRVVAPVPVHAALALAGLPIARFGDAQQQQRWLTGLASGEMRFTAALQDADSGVATPPATRARPDGDGWVLDGSKRLVPAVDGARGVLVPAVTPDGIGIFVVDPSSTGVRLGRRLSSRREPLFDLDLSGVRVTRDELLGGDPALPESALGWLRDVATVGVCATQLGVSARAIEITCAHLREREQFGAPIGSFPAVQQRAADAYIDLEAMRWTTWSAAWHLACGDDAGREVAVAKFWAAEAGARVAATAQHLHGGLGVDVDYPIHRYFLWSRALALSHGGATSQLARLGRDMARSGNRDLA